MPPINFPIVVLWFIGILIIVAAFLSSRQSSRKKRLLFQQMARKWNGRITFSAVYARKLHITRDNLDLVVYTEPGGKSARSPPRTFVVADVDVPGNYRMQIGREERLLGIGTIFGQDIRTNNPELDDCFVIKGQNDYIVRSLLTEEVQNRLLEFKHLRLTVKLKTNKLKLALGEELDSEEEYDRLINLALAIVKKAYGKRGMSL